MTIEYSITLLLYRSRELHKKNCITTAYEYKISSCEKKKNAFSLRQFVKKRKTKINEAFLIIFTPP